MLIKLPNTSGDLSEYKLAGTPVKAGKLEPDSARVVLSAAHVVADPFSAANPLGATNIDWQSTLKFRHYLHSLGLGIAEAMDTAQRGMGLDWPGALELIRQTRTELPDALVFNGSGTDHLVPEDARSLDDVKRVYLEQIEAIQKLDGRIILMASRALAAVAKTPQDYIDIYTDVLSACDKPVILHWLGPIFDPALEGYWGVTDFSEAMDCVLTIINGNQKKVDGIKISLLDKNKEIEMRRKLPSGVKMYTGDDFHYPELIEGDEDGYSHALLGIFDPLAAAAAYAVEQLSNGDNEMFRATLEPTVPLARQIFRAPTQHYKTGVVFLAWLNGFQDHFIMLNGAQAARPLPDFVSIFKMADECGLLRDPELAVKRMNRLLGIYGVG